MRKHILAALCFFAMSLPLGAPAFGGTVQPLTGPQDPSQLQAVINSLIVSGNAAWNPAGASFVNSATVSAIASATVTITNVGPGGLSPSTIVEWLRIRNASGVYRLIPMWGCPSC